LILKHLVYFGGRKVSQKLYKINSNIVVVVELDLIPFLTTFISTILLGADYGLLIGVAVNIIFVLYASARPKFDIDNEKLSNGEGNAVVITPKDTLYFPAAEHLRDTALDLEGDNITVIINGKYVRSIDITVAKVNSHLFCLFITYYLQEYSGTV
jgi:MFS superfamily sulfate permease-like transporter